MNTMRRLKMLLRFYKRQRGRYRRLQRLLFMSPAEAKFVTIMGGHTWTFPLQHPRTGFPLTVVWMGRFLRREKVVREVRVGRFFVDFGNDIGRAIEIDGSAYHMDIALDQLRDDMLYEEGWIVKRIPAHRLWRDRQNVVEEVKWFLTK